MPFIRLETTERVPPDQRASLCAALSRLCSDAVGKPEAYVMAAVHDQVTMIHAGAPGPAAFVEVRSIGGLSAKVNRALAEKVCRLVGETLRIPGERVYLNMADVAADHWGHDGSTFG